MLFYLLISLNLAMVTSHMGMTITPASTRIYPRSRAKIGDNYRFPNHPAMGRACHGTTKGNPVATLAAGTSVTATTSNGAGHNGGQCAWFLSTDQKTWYKISEVADCTGTSADGQRFDVTPPANAPAACASDTGCILGWFWSPVSSGACETYSNCFDVKITGATGGMETTVPTITTPITKCVRVNRQTKLTPMFGAAVGSGGSGGTGGTTPPDNSGGTGGAPERDCATYTVKQGDTLSSIATDFDIEGYYVDNVLFDGYQKIYQLNMETMKNENTIDVGQVLKMPGGDCLKDGQVAAPTPSGNGNGTAGSSVPCICPGEEGFEQNCVLNEMNRCVQEDEYERMGTGGIVGIVLLVMLIVSSLTFGVGFMVGKKQGMENGPKGAAAAASVAMGTKV